MQGVLCSRQVSFRRVSPVARLARGSSVPSIQVRWTSLTPLIRRGAVISRGHLLARLFRVGRRLRFRRRRRTKDPRRIRDRNSQDGEENMTFPSGGSRKPMSELRRSIPAPSSWPTCSISPKSRSSTFRISSCLILRQSHASFGQHSRSLDRDNPVIHSLLVSPAGYQGSSGLPWPSYQKRFSIGAASRAQTIDTNDNAVIACLAFWSSASEINRMEFDDASVVACRPVSDEDSGRTPAHDRTIIAPQLAEGDKFGNGV